MKGGAKVVVEGHRHEGIFIARGKEDALVTRNMAPGESVYGEKRISVDNAETGEKVEYRVWNPFRSKLAAAVLGGVDNIWVKPGAKVLYLGAANGTSVSHVSDIVGPTGAVYAVEFSHRSGRDLVNMVRSPSLAISLSFIPRSSFHQRPSFPHPLSVYQLLPPTARSHLPPTPPRPRSARTLCPSLRTPAVPSATA